MTITSARFIIPIDVYPFDLYVSLGETDVRFRQGLLRYKPEAWCDKALKKMDVAPLPGKARFGRNEGLYMIRTGTYPENAQDFGTLQHELFHFVERLFDDIGMRHHIDYTSEAFAYLIGHLTTQLYQRLWEVGQKQNSYEPAPLTDLTDLSQCCTVSPPTT